MAVPRFPSKAGKQSYNAAISRHDRGARLGVTTDEQGSHQGIPLSVGRRPWFTRSRNPRQGTSSESH
jgi:hypothetical protein